MPADIDQLLKAAAAAPSRDIDPAALRARAARARRRDRVVSGIGAIAVIVFAATLLTARDPAVELGPAGPTDDPAPEEPAQPVEAIVPAGGEVTLPARGEVATAWVDVPDGPPQPVFVVHAPGGAAHVVLAVTPYLDGVDAVVGWCAEGATLLSWRLGAVFAPDGSYVGGPPGRGLDTFDAEITDRGTVRIGERRTGASREASKVTAAAQSQLWGQQDHDRCFEAASPQAALLLHGVPGQDLQVAADAALAADDVALTGPDRPRGWVLVRGGLVVDGDTRPPLLCSELASEDPPTCPPDAPRVRMPGPGSAGPTWAETGLFRAIVTGDQFDRLTLVTGDLSHVDAPTPPLLVPPLQHSDGVVEGRTVTVAAGDIYFGPPPPPFPAGTYELRLDNSGSLPHTLVNDDLGVSLRADPRQRDSTTVELPPGQHTFICEIPGHTEHMQITLTVQ